MRWRNWLRHYTTNGKVAVLFPDGVIGIFHSERTVALGSTQADSNSNEYQKYFMGVKAACEGVDNLTTIICRFSRNLGVSTSWNTKDLSRPVQVLLYLLQVMLAS